jgi:hypothetical protein
MDLTEKQIAARAAAKAQLSIDAARDIEQAGRALGVVMDHCKSNTVDVKTAQILSIAQAYIAGAQGAILDYVAGDQIQETIKPGTGIIVG